MIENNGITPWDHNGVYNDIINHCDITWVALSCGFGDTCVAAGCIPILWKN